MYRCLADSVVMYMIYDILIYILNKPAYLKLITFWKSACHNWSKTIKNSKHESVQENFTWKYLFEEYIIRLVKTKTDY